MDIRRLLDRDTIAVRVRAPDKPHALAAAAELASRKTGLAAQLILAALERRESEGSTGVGGGLAIPHARLAGMIGVQPLFLRLAKPVAFDAVDGRPVDILLVLLAPEGADADHLRALAAASRLLRNKPLIERLRNAEADDAALALLAAEPETSAA